MKHVPAFSVFLCLLVMLSAVTACSEPITIASAGRFAMGLRFGPQVDASAQMDFIRILRAMTGASPMPHQAAGGTIVVGAKDFAHFAGKYNDLSGVDTFQIAAADGKIHLVGATPQAVTHAIYAFLNDLGCRWYMPGPLGEVIPKRPNLAWNGMPRVETPDFEFREIWWAYGGPPETAEEFRWWLKRNRTSSRVVAHGHNLTNTVPPVKYFDEHPEYYALVDGKRQTTQLCTSNQDVIRLTIEHIDAAFDKDPSRMSYSLCPDDNMEFCECTECVALDNKKGVTRVLDGHPNITDRLQVYLNAVAQGIQVKHPGKMVTTYAYVNYSTPPVREAVDPHVAVVFTTSVYCGGHGIGDTDCASRQEMRRDLAGWAKACKNTYIYEYDPIPFNAELPWPMYGTHGRSMPEYKALGIRGFSFEGHNSWATLFPNFYVSARMMWDADQDYDALMSDICEGCFGEGAEAMRAFYDAMDTAIRRYPTKIEWGQKAYPQIFPPEVVSRCRAHLGAAEQAASDPAVRARINMVSTGYEYFEAYLRCREAAKGEMAYEDYKVIRDRCDTLVDALHAENKDFIMAEVAKDYLGRELGALVSEQYAAEMGFVNQWMLIGPFDNANRKGHKTAYPPETRLDFTRSYPGMNGERLEWTPFNGQSWQGMLDLVTLIGAVEWGAAYAACQITSPCEQEVYCRVGSNDSVKVFLNGTEVWDNPIYSGRILTMDDDVFPIALCKGKSTLLVKVSNMGGNWGFCLRITDEKGNAIKGLKSSLAF